MHRNLHATREDIRYETQSYLDVAWVVEAFGYRAYLGGHCPCRLLHNPSIGRSATAENRTRGDLQPPAFPHRPGRVMP